MRKTKISSSSLPKPRQRSHRSGNGLRASRISRSEVVLGRNPWYTSVCWLVVVQWKLTVERGGLREPLSGYSYVLLYFGYHSSVRISHTGYAVHVIFLQKYSWRSRGSVIYRPGSIPVSIRSSIAISGTRLSRFSRAIEGITTPWENRHVPDGKPYQCVRQSRHKSQGIISITDNLSSGIRNPPLPIEYFPLVKLCDIYTTHYGN